MHISYMVAPLAALLVLIDAPRPAGGPCAPTHAVVSALYHSVLRRSPDGGGRQFFAAELEANRLTVRGAVSFMVRSEEYKRRFVFSDLVRTMYRQLLDRDIDLTQDRYFLDQLSAGAFDVRTAVLKTMHSEEYALRFFQGSGSDIAAALYRRLLAREPESPGAAAYWAEEARRDGWPRVIERFIGGPEYSTKWGPHTVPGHRSIYRSAATNLYRSALGRIADPAEIDSLAEGMAALGYDAAADAFTRSAEYNRLFGDHVVPGRPADQQPTFCGSASINPPKNAALIERFVITPASIAAGDTATFRIRLAVPAPPGGVTVVFSSITNTGLTDTIVNMPTSFQFPQGTQESEMVVRTRRITNERTHIVFTAATMTHKQSAEITIR